MRVAHRALDSVLLEGALAGNPPLRTRPKPNLLRWLALLTLATSVDTRIVEHIHPLGVSLEAHHHTQAVGPRTGGGHRGELRAHRDDNHVIGAVAVLQSEVGVERTRLVASHGLELTQQIIESSTRQRPALLGGHPGPFLDGTVVHILLYYT